MSESESVYDDNEAVARKIHEEAQRDPHSPYIKKCLLIVDGQVVVVADDWDEVDRRLQEIEADPKKCYCAWIDPDTHFGAENEIWELH